MYTWGNLKSSLHFVLITFNTLEYTTVYDCIVFYDIIQSGSVTEILTEIKCLTEQSAVSPIAVV